ncbi:heavy metal translocating P-type ATPase [Elongatibacter sediminis]|uniref:Heavy metal translocating P-type ATPase n=1 Tax=Elongatibacter sediminis TaxID=3119006 RepID=A0AAW9R7B5_9GAMM
MENAESTCFHCGEPVPPDLHLEVEIDGVERPMCCHGCRAVAQLIHASGLGRFYRFRQELNRRVDPAAQEAREAWSAVDSREALWGRERDDGTRELLLQTEGIRCAACAWLIRSRLESFEGIRAVQVDTATGFTRIVWNPALIRLSAIAGALFDLGYIPHLPLAESEEEGRRAERRDSLRRLGVAGLGMMQVMMYAVGLYAGEFQGGMSAASRGFLTWLSLIVTLPVVLYSGRVFFVGAWRGLRAGRPGMDLPVALAIGLAFLASCVNFFRGSGEVWFDSVVMFIFFLTLGRHVELVLRHRNLQAGSALARLLPEWARRITAQGTETLPAIDLEQGDRVRVAAGSAFPCDGRIVDGATDVDESLLSGESRPVLRQTGDAVIAGSINLSQSVDVEATAAAGETTVSSLGRMLLQGRSDSRDAGGVPGWLVPVFTVGVLVLAALTGWYWQSADAERAFPAALAVLVASCPCALSLALPAVQAAASRGLLQSGILLTRSRALHTLPQVDTVVFDKTGTLTRGDPVRGHLSLNPGRPEADSSRLLAIAAGLESHSAHPVARAFRDIANAVPVEAVRSIAGRGVEGRIDGERWRIGSARFVDPVAPESSGDPSGGEVWLGDERGWLACWTLSDTLRPGVRETVAALRARGLQLRICSGDAAAPVGHVAETLGIDVWSSRCSPEDKLSIIKKLQKQGRTVLMIGDGVNDAPVLAGADASMAVSGATELANSSADLVLTAENLQRVEVAFEAGRKAVRLVRQNLTWALMYNASVLPWAVSGALQPWMAAIGMSASSLLVVLNAARMAAGPRRGEGSGPPGIAREALVR